MTVAEMGKLLNRRSLERRSHHRFESNHRDGIIAQENFLLAFENRIVYQLAICLEGAGAAPIIPRTGISWKDAGQRVRSIHKYGDTRGDANAV